jgi:hypothetical protein
MRAGSLNDALENFCNDSGPNQYFPRNTLFSPPSGERIVCFALEKWLA